MNAIGKTYLISEKIKEEIEGPYDANQYFPIMKEGLEVRNNKMTVIIL